jgi:hypothetical protein
MGASRCRGVGYRRRSGESRARALYEAARNDLGLQKGSAPGIYDWQFLETARTGQKFICNSKSWPGGSKNIFKVTGCHG